MECSIWIFKWRHLVGKFRTNAVSAIWWPKLEPMERLSWIFLSSEFSCFEAGEIIQVIETLTRSVVPLAMFHSNMHFLICYKIWKSGSKVVHQVESLALPHCHIATVTMQHTLKQWWAAFWTAHSGEFTFLTNNLATLWRYLHQIQTWPRGGTTFINWKFGHIRVTSFKFQKCVLVS